MFAVALPAAVTALTHALERGFLWRRKESVSWLRSVHVGGHLLRLGVTQQHAPTAAARITNVWNWYEGTSNSFITALGQGEPPGLREIDLAAGHLPVTMHVRSLVADLRQAAKRRRAVSDGASWPRRCTNRPASRPRR